MMFEPFKSLFGYVVDHSPTFLLFLFSLCGVLVIALGYLLFRLFFISKLRDQHNFQHAELLRGQADEWLSWWSKDKMALCSRRLKEDMGGGTAPSIPIKRLEVFFVGFNLEVFCKTVETQRKYQQELKSKNGDTFRLMGASRKFRGRFFYVIWVRNISHQAAKIKLLNDVVSELQVEHEMMQKILNQLPVPVWYKSSTEELLYCNKAYANALDCSVDKALTDQLILKSWQQGGRLPNLTDLVVRTQQTQTQRSHIVMHNDRHFVEISETPTGKKSVLGYMLNLSTEEKLQNDIYHLNLSMKEVLEVISLPVIIYNSQQQVEFFNAPFLSMFELDAEWLETKPTFSEVLEELRVLRKIPDTEDFLSYKSRRLGCFNNLLEPIEDIAYYPDGRTARMVTAPYHDGGLMLTFNDITDHLSLERSYNTLLAVHRQVADNLFEGLAVFGSDHKLKLFNSAFCKMWNYESKDLEASPHLDTVIGTIKQYIDYNHYDPNWENFKSRIRAKIIDRSQKKEGRIKLYNDVVYDYLYTPLPDGSNLLTFLDISDRYRIEKSLLERSEALELAHSVKSDFIATVHQGVKYPLRRVLVNFTDIFESRFGEVPEKYQEILRSVWQEIDQILRFIEDANDLASIESGNAALKTSDINLVELIKNVNQTLAERIDEKSLNVVLAYDTRFNFTIKGDLRRLKQMFFNLLRNAIVFAKQKELIKITIEGDGSSICVEMSTEQAVIPYEDTYGASKKLKRGQRVITGLGFSLIKKIMKLHAGHVTLSHESGTVVRCSFEYKKN